MQYAQSIKVGYVLKMYPRFSETFIVNEILAHESAGLEIEIFSLRPPNDGRFHEALAKIQAPVHYLPSSDLKVKSFWAVIQETSAHFPDLWKVLADFSNENPRDIYQALLLAQAIKQSGITHLHAHFGSVATTVARIAARIVDLPYSFTAHAKDIFHESVNTDDLRNKLTDAATTITVSDFNFDYLNNTYDSAAHSVRRIYNGIDLTRFAFVSPADRPAEIISVGRLVEKKGFPDLISACAILAEKKYHFIARLLAKVHLKINFVSRSMNFPLL